MYSKNMLSFQDSTKILNASMKKSGNLFNASPIYMKMVYLGRIFLFK